MYIIDEWYGFPPKYHSWTSNQLSKATFSCSWSSFIKHLKTLWESHKSVSTLFFPGKCKAVKHSTSSSATVLCLQFIEWEWFYRTMLKLGILKPVKSFWILWVRNREGRRWLNYLCHCFSFLILESQISTLFLLCIPLWYSEYRWWRLIESFNTRGTMLEVVGKKTLCMSENIKTLRKDFSLGIVG